MTSAAPGHDVTALVEAFATTGRPPPAPSASECAWLLAELRALCEVAGTGRLLAPPATPSPDLFATWQPSPSGVTAVIATLCELADARDLGIEVHDERHLAVSTDRMRVTEVELTTAAGARPRLALLSIGTDDVAGTLAHDVGVAMVAAMPTVTGAPFRDHGPGDGSGTSAEASEHLHARGSVASVWAGLGALAINATYQQTAGGDYRVERGFAPLEYAVIRAGYLPLPAMAFLLAVQGVVRGARAIPDGLVGPAADETGAWMDAMRRHRNELRALLGISADQARDPALARRDRPWPSWGSTLLVASDTVAPEEPASEMSLADPMVGVTAPGSRRGQPVYRVAYRRIGGGLLVGAAAGIGVAIVAKLSWAVLVTLPLGAAAGAAIKVDRCATCIEVLPAGLTVCPRCGGQIVGRVAHREQRLLDDGAEGADGAGDQLAASRDDVRE